MSFGTPSPKSVPTTTIQQNTLPEWVKREGEALYLDRAQPAADRPFPGFPVGERIEPFGGDTTGAFALARRETGLGMPAQPGTGMPANPPGFPAHPLGGTGVSQHNVPGGGTNPEWTRINALLQSTNPEITTRGVDNASEITKLQAELAALQKQAQVSPDLSSDGSFQGDQGSFGGDPRTDRSIADLTGRISTLQTANTPDTTGANPEWTALQSQLSGINPRLQGAPLPGTPGTPAGQPAWAEAFNAAMRGTAAGAVPVGQSDIERYFNPFTQQVIDPVVNQIERGFTRDTAQRHGELARRGSYLNEDRRGSMDILAGEAKDRTIAETTARLRMGAFGDALQQGNVERNRTMAAGAQFGQLAPQRQQLGIRDIATLTGIGGMQEAKGQENRTLNFEEFMRQFSYPQNQTGFLTSVLSGIPYETGRTTQGQTLIGQSNPFTQALGLGISAAGLFL